MEMLERASWRFLYSFLVIVCLCWGVAVGSDIKKNLPQTKNGNATERVAHGNQVATQAQRNTTNVILNNSDGGGGGWGWGKGGEGCGRGANNKGEGRLGAKKKDSLDGYGVFEVGEYARCMRKGTCKGMKLICPLHCHGPCFYDCVKFCRPRCKH